MMEDDKDPILTEVSNENPPPMEPLPNKVPEPTITFYEVPKSPNELKDHLNFILQTSKLYAIQSKEQKKPLTKAQKRSRAKARRARVARKITRNRNK